MPSLTRSGRPSASLAASSADEITSMAPLLSRAACSWASFCVVTSPVSVQETADAENLRERASQALQWERGEKHPRGASLKLLVPVAKNRLGAVA